MTLAFSIVWACGFSPLRKIAGVSSAYGVDGVVDGMDSQFDPLG